MKKRFIGISLILVFFAMVSFVVVESNYKNNLGNTKRDVEENNSKEEFFSDVEDDKSETDVENNEEIDNTEENDLENNSNSQPEDSSGTSNSESDVESQKPITPTKPQEPELESIPEPTPEPTPEPSITNPPQVENNDGYEEELKKVEYNDYQVCMDEGFAIAFSDTVNILGFSCRDVYWNGQVIGYYLKIDYTNPMLGE